MDLNIQILEIKKIGDVECTRPIKEYTESEIPEVMARLDWFSNFTNESGEGWVEICENHFEGFINDCEWDINIEWTNQDLDFIHTIEKELEKSDYGFVRLSIY